MADFTITIPDAFVPRLIDPVNYRATNIEPMPVVQKILAAWGEPTVAGLTATQKGELCALLHLWQLVQQAERSAAGDAAYAAADQAVLDDFNP